MLLIGLDDGVPHRNGSIAKTARDFTASNRLSEMLAIPNHPGNPLGCRRNDLIEPLEEIVGIGEDVFDEALSDIRRFSDGTANRHRLLFRNATDGLTVGSPVAFRLVLTICFLLRHQAQAPTACGASGRNCRCPARPPSQH